MKVKTLLKKLRNKKLKNFDITIENSRTIHKGRKIIIDKDFETVIIRSYK